MSAPMVRAILEGRKSQTRRLLKPRHDYFVEDGKAYFESYVYAEPECPEVPCPYGAPGDRLWVRETHALAPACSDPDPEIDSDWHVIYRADGDPRFERDWQNHDGEPVRAPWKPSIFMPRWASRITLEVTGVRVERLHAITEEDARAEGCLGYPGCVDATPREEFEELWKDINGADSWKANPWVWVIEFRRVEAQECAA